MKPYKKPVIISEQVLEKVALGCTGYMYYTKEVNPCYDEFLGTGKIGSECAECFT